MLIWQGLPLFCKTQPFFSAVVIFLQLGLATEQLKLQALIQRRQQPLPLGGQRVSDGTRMVSA